MPGGRLTYEDRRRVAAGLREGLSYAEIARDLGRPRSTISREVARNGGATGYRANLAHQATGWRARRRRPSLHPAAAEPAGSDAQGPDAQAVREFEESFAAMMIQTGVPTMRARVLACLFTGDSDGLTAAELAARLQVSPASISKVIAWLEIRALVRREQEGRRQRYLIDDDVWYHAWRTSVRSMDMWVEAARRGARLLGPATPAGARLDTASRFFELLGNDMLQAAEHWRQTLAAQR